MSRPNCPESEMSQLFLDPAQKCLKTLRQHFGTVCYCFAADYYCPPGMYAAKTALFGKKTIFAYCLFISVFGDSVGNVDTSSISSSVASHVSTGQQEYYKIIPCIGLYIRYYIHLPACTSDLCRPTDLVRNSRSDQGSSFEYRRARQLASR